MIWPPFIRLLALGFSDSFAATTGVPLTTALIIFLLSTCAQNKAGHIRSLSPPSGFKQRVAPCLRPFTARGKTFELDR